MKLIIDIKVKDLKRAVDFYESILELPVITVDQTWAAISVGDAEVHLYCDGGVTGHVEFYVEDIDAEVERLVQNGVKFISGMDKSQAIDMSNTMITSFPWGRTAFFHDSEGNELAIVKIISSIPEKSLMKEEIPMPGGKEAVKALVQLLPYVGGPLSTLIFDKAEGIRVENLEIGMEALADEIRRDAENRIDREWFETEDALSTFRVFFERIAYETDKEKIRMLSRVIFNISHTDNLEDKNRIYLLEQIARLTHLQIELLLEALEVAKAERNDIKSGQAVIARWHKAIEAKFCIGNYEGVNVKRELDILTSLGFLQWATQVNLRFPEQGYIYTDIGKDAVKYLGKEYPKNQGMRKEIKF